MNRIRKKVSCLGLLLLFPALLSAQAMPQKGIVDMHCHIACLDEKNGCFVADDLKDNFRFPIYIRAMGTSLDELKVQGDEVIAKRLNQQIKQSQYVDSAVILAMDGVVTDGELDRSKTMVYVPNVYVAELAKKYPHLLFGASINPYRHDALARLVQAKQDGAVLIKWLPSIMNIDPSDESLIPFYQKMIALDLPLLTHTGDEHSFTSADNRLGDPRKLVLPARLGVKVIAAHIATTGKSGGVSNFELLLPLMKQYPNLYADISSLTQINKLGYLKQAMQVKGLEKQLVYGTDWPLQFFPITSPWYFPADLSIKQMWQLSHQENQWDRDVLLKKALHVPDEVFQRSAKLLGIK